MEEGGDMRQLLLMLMTAIISLAAFDTRAEQVTYPKDKETRIKLGYAAAECAAFYIRAKQCEDKNKKPYRGIDSFIDAYSTIARETLGDIAEKCILDDTNKIILHTQECGITSELIFQYLEKCGSLILSLPPSGKAP